MSEKGDRLREAAQRADEIEALEEENYVDSDDQNKLNEELDKILKDLGIELEYDE